MCENASYEKEIQKHNASCKVNIFNLFTKGFYFITDLRLMSSPAMRNKLILWKVIRFRQCAAICGSNLIVLISL